MTSLNLLRDGFARAGLPALLVDELLQAYNESKRNYSLGGHRLSEVEGGRFCEAAFRLLEYIANGKYTSFGGNLNTNGLINHLQSLPSNEFPTSIRILIPRTLRVVYDFRNYRDVAHIADGIDPSRQDATLVMAALNWILAELVRLYHQISPTEAQSAISDLTTQNIPVIQEFDGSPRVLRPDLRAGDYCLVLLYHAGSSVTLISQLTSLVRPSMRKHLKSTLGRLDEKALIHLNGDKCVITWKGQQDVENRHLLE